MDVTVVPPVAHPTVSFVGRTCGVDAGPQDKTAGTGAVVVVVEEDVVVVPPCAVVVDTPLAVDLVVGGEFEPTTRPTAIPIPRAARTSATMPTLTYVLRLTVMTRESLSTTRANGSSERCCKDDRFCRSPTADRRRRVRSRQENDVTGQPLSPECVSNRDL
jgi:hypothetical protein